jgi:hypothetical protein
MLGLSPLSAAPVSGLSGLSTSTDRYAYASSVIVLSQGGIPQDVYRSIDQSILLSQRALLPFVEVFATSAITLTNADSNTNINAASSLVISQSAVPVDVFQTVEQSIIISSYCAPRSGYLASGRYRR